ncbi:MAG: hypothetical protein ACYC4L_05080 [Chloroflexota bacterium]
MHIGFGIEVISGDGEQVGHVECLVVSPADNMFSHFGLREDDGQERLLAVPVWLLARAEDGEVRLEPSKAELSLLPRLDALRPSSGADAAGMGQEPGEFPSLPLDEIGIPGEAVLLTERTELNCEKRAVGTLAAVFADDYTAEVTTLVVRLRGGGRLVDVPMVWARSVGPERIALACENQALESMPDTVWQPSP